MRLIFSVFFLFLSVIAELNAQTPVLVTDQQFQIATQSAIDSLYNRNPEAAREILKPWSEAHPDHPVWQLWDAMEFWWLILTDLYNESYDKEFFRKMELADQAAAGLLRKSPDHPDGHIIRAVANGYSARQHANRNRWLQSVRTARTAQKAHSSLSHAAPDLADNLFAEGLKQYYAAYLPEAYPVVRAVSWLLPSGDKREGLKLLEQTSRDAVFARPESIYFLGVILLNYEHEYAKAVTRFNELVDYYPNNSYYRRLLVRTLYQQRKNQVAAEMIESTLQHWNKMDFEDRDVTAEELLYWRGRIQMRYGDYEDALKSFEESYQIGFTLPNQKKRAFHALSGYYGGITAERTDDFNSARNFYDAVIQMECEDEVRKRAKERLKELRD